MEFGPGQGPILFLELRTLWGDAVAGRGQTISYASGEAPWTGSGLGSLFGSSEPEDDDANDRRVGAFHFDRLEPQAYTLRVYVDPK